jgi:hypothetical protein
MSRLDYARKQTGGIKGGGDASAHHEVIGEVNQRLLESGKKARR